MEDFSNGGAKLQRGAEITKLFFKFPAIFFGRKRSENLELSDFIRIFAASLRVIFLMCDERVSDTGGARGGSTGG